MKRWSSPRENVGNCNHYCIEAGRRRKLQAEIFDEKLNLNDLSLKGFHIVMLIVGHDLIERCCADTATNAVLLTWACTYCNGACRVESDQTEIWHETVINTMWDWIRRKTFRRMFSSDSLSHYSAYSGWQKVTATFCKYSSDGTNVEQDSCRVPWYSYNRRPR